MTASNLFSLIDFFGENKCALCGTNCGSNYLKKDYISPKFTNFDAMICPGSNYICPGCADSLSSNFTIELITGEIRENQRVRAYSWLLTKDKRIAFTKSNLSELRELILNPPAPPFALILADSLRKQLIFRSPVAFENDNYPLRLEEEIILVNLNKLKSLNNLALHCCAAFGKPALLNCDSLNYAQTFFKTWGRLQEYEEWVKEKKTSLAKLAVWLCKNKEESTNELNIRR